MITLTSEVTEYISVRRRDADWFATSAQIADRTEICEACKYLVDLRCKAFSCNLHQAVKVSRLISAKAQSCPKKKW